MRRGPLPAVVAALLTGLGLAASAEAADQSVSATPSDTFAPASVTVNQGDTVTWTNAGGSHNVVFEDGSFTEPGPPDNDPWVVQRTFGTVGTFGYYCSAHQDEGMTGTVTVLASGTPQPPPGGGPPAPPTAPDSTKPAVTAFTIKSRRFRVTKAGRPFTFRLSEAASVKIVVARKVGRRHRTKGTLTRRSLPAGSHTIAFRGRLAGKKLAPGVYRATLTATDEAGNRSAPDRVKFRVLRRR